MNSGALDPYQLALHAVVQIAFRSQCLKRRDGNAMNFHSAGFLLEHSRRDGVDLRPHINKRVINAAVPLAVGTVMALLPPPAERWPTGCQRENRLPCSP